MPSLFNKTIIYLFILSTGLFLNFAIPPFQNPDEPQHFKLILTHAFGQVKATAMEKDIIEFMDKCNWWRFVGFRRPKILPTELTQTDFIRNVSRRTTNTFSIELYHFLLGKTAGLFVKKNIEALYYLCRFLTLLIYSGSILLVFFASHNMAKASHGHLIFSTFFILFLPQLAVTSIAVNPDGFAIFVCVLFFYVATLFALREFQFRYFVFLVLIAAVGFVTDKSVFFLIPLVPLIPILYAKKENWKANLMRTVLFSWTVVLLLAWIAWYLPSPFFNNLNVIGTKFWSSIPEALGFIAMNEFNARFFSLIADSYFFRFGWMAYAAEGIYYFIFKVFLLSSLLGMMIYFCRAVYLKLKRIQSNLFKSGSVKLMAFFSIVFVLQLFLVWIIWAPRHVLAQGRYLFPVLIPIAGLFVTGVFSLFSVIHKKAGRAVISILVVAEFLFLNYAIWNYIIPVFHLIQMPPLPGL